MDRQSGTFSAVGSGGSWMITTREVDGIFSIIWMSALLSVATFSSPVLAVKIQRLIEMMTRLGGFFWSLLMTALFQVSHWGYGISGGPYHIRSLRLRKEQLIFRYGISFQPWALATALTPGNRAEACESPTRATV